MARAALGMVHGRFQPFHNDHLQYAMEAAARCSSLVVGVTNPEASQIAYEPSEPERSAPGANPFPFHLRARMIRDAVADAGLDLRTVLIVPFPLHQDPERWADYVPPEVVHYLRVFSAWGEEKVRRLQAAGQVVVDLAGGRTKGISASEVRRRLREGGDWRSLVPPAVADLLTGAASPWTGH